MIAASEQEVCTYIFMLNHTLSWFMIMCADH